MLEEERRYYDEHLQGWLEHYRERFVLVKGTELVGAFNTIDEALSEGARRFGLVPFLVRQVLPEQPRVDVPALTLGVLGANPAYSVHGTIRPAGR